MTRLLAGFARRRMGDAWPQGLLESAAVTATIWEEAGGPIGSALRGSLHGRRREQNPMGISPSDVFPLPGVSLPNLRRWGRVGQGDLHEVLAVVNVTVSCVNYLYCGVDGSMGNAPASAAQQRALQTIVGSVVRFFLPSMARPSADEIQKQLRLIGSYAGPGTTAIPLGDKGGLPPCGADIDVADVLKNNFPDIARQVVSPTALLLPRRLRPKKVKKRYASLAGSYPKLVDRLVGCGVCRLLPRKKIWKHEGKTLVSGVFAVPKDDVEDRVITDVAANDLLDPEKLPRPSFAYPPRLRVLQLRRDQRIVLFKRDARHYFHHLAIGRRWEKYLAWPAIYKNDVEMFPVQRSVPMGFGPAAGWAQAVTDEAVLRAGLPTSQQVSATGTVPDSLPVWGSILDDVWAIDEAKKPGEGDGEGKKWIDSVDAAWREIGVPVNEKKNVDGEEDAEFQGVQLHGRQHWLGVSRKKRAHLMVAIWDVCSRGPCAPCTVARVVGKLGFCFSFRSCLRSILQTVYLWLEEKEKVYRVPLWLPASVREELLMASWLLPSPRRT